MNAQRKTVYEIRQQLLEGRYTPEQLDELGKATGKPRTIAPSQVVVDMVKPWVGQLLGTFLEAPIGPRNADGSPREIGHEALEGGKLVELDQLQKEIYQLWGVRVTPADFEGAPAEFYDFLMELVPQALAEQRDRALDLIDRIIGAMVEESCPGNRPPEDWDWAGLKEGFEQHFTAVPQGIEGFGDQELLAQELFRIADGIFEQHEKDLGPELLLRVFRHLYLEEIDKAWIEHLTNMDHLRDGIGLRGYGQRDPKQEYKKEGFNLFVNMMAAVSSNVATKMIRVSVQRQEQAAEIEAEDAARRQAALQGASARHGYELSEGDSLAPPGGRLEGAQPEVMAAKPAPKLSPNDPCPCGSGKKFKKCHGSFGADDKSDASE